MPKKSRNPNTIRNAERFKELLDESRDAFGRLYAAHKLHRKMNKSSEFDQGSDL